MPVSAADLVSEARTWKNTPWVDEGRLKGIAVDCLGLILGVGHNLGLIDQSVQFFGYGRIPKDDGQIERVLANYADPVPPREKLPGDVPLFLLPKTKNPMHIGIVGDYPLGGLSLIHASGSTISRQFPRGRVVECRLDERWEKYIVSAWRYRGLA